MVDKVRHLFHRLDTGKLSNFGIYHNHIARRLVKGKEKPKSMGTANCLEKSLAPWPYWLRVTSGLWRARLWGFEIVWSAELWQQSKQSAVTATGRPFWWGKAVLIHSDWWWGRRVFSCSVAQKLSCSMMGKKQRIRFSRHDDWCQCRMKALNTPPFDLAASCVSFYRAVCSL